MTRRDLLLQIGELDRWSRSGTRAASPAASSASTCWGWTPTPAPGDELGGTLIGGDPAGSGLPEFTDAELVRAELEVLGLDASRHVVDFYRRFLSALGAVPAGELLGCRSEAEVLVAGVKVATQTPPIRSGRRVVFVTLDDGTGCTDSTFFEDVQGPYAATVFHSWLLVIRGVLRRTGPRGVSLRATGAWELPALHEAWEAGGLEAVAELMAAPGAYTEQAIAGAAASHGSRPVVVRPVLVHPTGFRMSPYADIKPAGEDAAVAVRRAASAPRNPAAPRKLWHSSPGSSGR